MRLKEIKQQLEQANAMVAKSARQFDELSKRHEEALKEQLELKQRNDAFHAELEITRHRHEELSMTFEKMRTVFAALNDLDPRPIVTREDIQKEVPAFTRLLNELNDSRAECARLKIRVSELEDARLKLATDFAALTATMKTTLERAGTRLSITASHNDE